MEQLNLFDQGLQTISIPDDIQNEYKELVKTLNYHAKRYYDEDTPEISDYEYDMMNNRLKEIERSYPSIVSPDSPSLRVGWKAAPRNHRPVSPKCRSWFWHPESPTLHPICHCS